MNLDKLEEGLFWISLDGKLLPANIRKTFYYIYENKEKVLMVSWIADIPGRPIGIYEHSNIEIVEKLVFVPHVDLMEKR